MLESSYRRARQRVMFGGRPPQPPSESEGSGDAKVVQPENLTDGNDEEST